MYSSIWVKIKTSRQCAESGGELLLTVFFMKMALPGKRYGRELFVVVYKRGAYVRICVLLGVSVFHFYLNRT